jgi:hypothetical protein
MLDEIKIMVNRLLWWWDWVDSQWSTFVVCIVVKPLVCLAMWNMLVDASALAKQM